MAQFRRIWIGRRSRSRTRFPRKSRSSFGERSGDSRIADLLRAGSKQIARSEGVAGIQERIRLRQGSTRRFRGKLRGRVFRRRNDLSSFLIGVVRAMRTNPGIKRHSSPLSAWIAVVRRADRPQDRLLRPRQAAREGRREGGGYPPPEGQRPKTARY